MDPDQTAPKEHFCEFILNGPMVQVFRCLVIVVWLFLMVPQVCLQFVILVFPDHTHFF